MDQQRIIDGVLKYRHLSFVKILQRTVFSLYPLILIGSFANVIGTNLLARNGFLARFFNISAWLPFREFLAAVFTDIARVTVGWSSPFAAMVAAILTTRYYHRENTSAGMAGMIAYVLIFYHSMRSNTQVVQMKYYNASWLIVGILVGYCVGRIFVRFGTKAIFKNFKQANETVMTNIIHNIKPLLISVGAAFLVHVCYALYRQFGLDQVVSQNLASLLSRHSNYLLNITLSLINTVLVWLGFAEPMASPSSAYTNEAYTNLIYALSHKSAWNLPHPFTPTALYSGFALFGGVGIGLALVIGILWADVRKRKHRIAAASLFPTFFNVDLPIMFGANVFWNPIYLIPFVLCPIFNMLIGSVVIFLHLMPPLVYPIPSGTPGVLVPLMATGGNVVALIVCLVLLFLDVLIYLPFIKLSEKVEIMDDQEKAGEHRD